MPTRLTGADAREKREEEARGAGMSAECKRRSKMTLESGRGF